MNPAERRLIAYTAAAHGTVHIMELTYPALLTRIEDDFGMRAVISGAIATVTIKAGTAGHLYNLRFRATLNTGSLLEEDATLSCQQEGH